MEVKIGVQRTPREIVLESTQSPDQVEHTARVLQLVPDGRLDLVGTLRALQHDLAWRPLHADLDLHRWVLLSSVLASERSDAAPPAPCALSETG